MKTLSQILIDANAYLDLTAEEPSNDDLTTRTNFANQAVTEWGSAYRFRQLHQSTTVFTTLASISLGSNFRELVYPPRGNSIEYPEIQPQERHAYSASDKYTYVLGNPSEGHTLVINGLPTSGVTLSFDWNRYPSGMATLSDVCEVPDPDFVRQTIIAKVLESRFDERFQEAKTEAQRLLSNMIGREQNLSPGGSQTVRRAGAAAYAIGSR